MKVLTFADVHSPDHLPLLTRSLKEADLAGVLLVLIAGDVVRRGEYTMCKPVERAVRSALPGAPVLAVFGNEDYPDVHDKLAEECSEIRWLDDELVILETEEGRVAIVGTTGVLDRPTRWQRTHILGIQELYRKRLSKVSELLKQARSADFSVLLTHYPPRCKTLTGEREEFWPEMSSSGLAVVIRSTSPSAVVHGHLHESRVHTDYLGPTPVYNAALPAVGGVRVIDVKKIGLSAWF